MVSEVDVALRDAERFDTCVHAEKVACVLATEVLSLREELAALRDGYDLLHKRIEAYDETHAYLQELREAATEFLEMVDDDADEVDGYLWDSVAKKLRAVIAKVTR